MLNNDFENEKTIKISPDIRAARLTEFISTESIMIQAVDLDRGEIFFRGEQYSVDEFVRHGYAKIKNGVYYVTKDDKVRQRNNKNLSEELLLINFQKAIVKDGKKAYNRLSDVLKDRRIFWVDPINLGDSPKIYVRMELANKRVFWPIESETNLFEKSKYLTSEDMKAFYEKGKVKVFWTWWNSPSATRTMKCSFIKAHGLDLKAEIARLEKMTDVISGGTYSTMKAAFADKEVAFDKLFKKVSRNTLMFTDSSRYGKVKTMAVVNIPDKDILYRDGQGIISSRVLEREYLKRHGKKVGAEKFVGLVLQARFGAVKGFHTVESPFSIASKLAYVIEKYGKQAVKLYGVSSYDFESLKKIDFVGDSNTVKADFFFEEEHDLCVMGLPKEIKKAGHTSVQISGPLMMIPGAINFFKRKMDLLIENLFPKEEKEINRISQIKDILYPVNTLKSLNRNIIFTDENLFKDYLKQIIESGLKSINRFHLPVDGSYALLVRDVGLDFGKALLKNNEVFIPEKDNGKADIYRHPKNAPGEHFLCKIVSKETLVKRIHSSSEYTEFQKIALLESINFLMSGAAMVPSGNKRFAALLGGCDYDGDGVIVIWDKEFIKLSEQIPCLAIDFGSAPASDNKKTFSFKLKDLCYLAQIENGNEPTGVTTNRNQAFLSLLYFVKNSSQEQLAEFFEFLKKQEEKCNDLKDIMHYSDTYLRMFDADNVLVDENAVLEFIARTKRCGFANRENLINILEDLFIVNASCVGRILDSAKNGAKVTVAFAELGRFVSSGMIKEYVFGIKERSGKTKFFDQDMNPNVNPIEFGYHGHTFIIKDMISEVKEYGKLRLLDEVERYKTVFKLFNKKEEE